MRIIFILWSFSVQKASTFRLLFISYLNPDFSFRFPWNEGGEDEKRNNKKLKIKLCRRISQSPCLSIKYPLVDNLFNKNPKAAFGDGCGHEGHSLHNNKQIN